jgi:hypothetical protein
LSDPAFLPVIEFAGVAPFGEGLGDHAVVAVHGGAEHALGDAADLPVEDDHQVCPGG